MRIFDESPFEKLSKPELVDEARALGLDLTLGWEGSFVADEWDGLVVNPAVRRDHPKVQEAIRRGVPILSEVEFAYQISAAPIIAITGTNGKSTTTVMTWLCLRACGIDAVLCGNIFGSGYPEMPLTDAANQATKQQILVAEVSSYGLEWITTFCPAVTGITNISPDHLDRYESFDDYARTKLKIFSQQTQSDFAVIRANDPVVPPPGGEAIGFRSRRTRMSPVGQMSRTTPTVLTFGATGREAQVDENALVILDQSLSIDALSFREPHNLTNASMASLLAYAGLRWIANHDPSSHAAQILEQAQSGLKRTSRNGGFDSKSPRAEQTRALPLAIIEGLKQFKGLAHRMELLGEKGGIRVINNSMCTNPDAVIKSAQSLHDPAQLLIGGVNKRLDFKPLANYLANGRHGAFLFGSDATALNKMLGGKFETFETLAEAFHAATLAARPGQAIMLSPGCASTDQFRDFRDRGEVFRTLAVEWLES